MKKMLLLLSVAVMLLSCEGEKLNYEFETKFIKDIDVSIGGEPEARGDEESYPFASSKIISIEDNSDVVKYLDDLEEIKIKSVSCIVKGLQPEQLINHLNIDIEGTPFNLFFTGINYLEIELPINLAKSVLDDLAKAMKEEKQMLVNVSGDTNISPIDFKITLTIDATVKTNVLE